MEINVIRSTDNDEALSQRPLETLILVRGQFPHRLIGPIRGSRPVKDDRQVSGTQVCNTQSQEGTGDLLPLTRDTLRLRPITSLTFGGQKGIKLMA
jgi:hypothetical protein